MGRRRLIGGCALGAASLAVICACSYVTPLSVPLLSLNHHALVLHFFDGRVRLFWFHSPATPIHVDDDGLQPTLRVVSAGADRAAAWADVEGPPAPPVFDIPVRIGSRSQVPFVGGRWRSEIAPRVPPPLFFSGQTWAVYSSFVRLPTWGLVILLIVPPIRRSILERRRLGRSRRNECLACGYSLIGLIEARCPECGAGFARATG